ncbi:type I secretion system permease/ATPase [Pseudooctadecabacter jejudonensis]|uniref:Toxin RTX-I translocation ATP-binding protein n=1 Tax=Pseudooctadecabacter jejudonensis TaxID=1391910 RepID=A0A1Y5T6J0_9RHOB|nr:type I secretion system permease/ATPase [Pseudooctadecabacter jejudonensis]SLN56681.1 Toxin RTX-I translocation ATP-binding protein [Pseudooctadecabacter jejudonensis]
MQSNNVYFLPDAKKNGHESDLLSGLVQYLGLIGKPITSEELIAGLPVTLEDFGVDDVRRAIQRIGYSSTVKSVGQLTARDLPACIKTHDGRFLTVLRMDGQNFVIAHPVLDDAVWIRTREQMQEDYAGLCIIAAPSTEALEAKHIGKTARGHWFWRHIFRQKWLSIEIVLATLVANCLAIAVSLFSLQVYDRVIPNASFQTLWVLAIGAAIAIVFETVLRISRGRLIDDMGRQVEINASAELMSSLQGMRMNERSAGPAALGSMMREFSSVREFFTATSMGSIADIPFVAVFLGIIYMIAGPVVAVVMTGVCLIVLLSVLTRGRLNRLSQEMQGTNSAQARVLNEVTYGAEAIKLNRAENKFQSDWEDIVHVMSDKTQSMRATAATLAYVSQGLQQAAYISVVVAGVYMVLAGEFTVGAIIAMSILTTRTIAPITQLSGAIAKWQQVKVALKGLTSITSARQERVAGRQYSRRDVLHGTIEIENLRFAYAQDQDTVLSVTKFDVSAGETIGMLGRNGSGKSTLLKILSGLYDFDTGDVRIDGLEMRQIDPVTLRRNIGFLTQDVTLFTGTLRENLTLGPTSADEGMLMTALEFCGLKKMVDRHPLGLDMPVSDGGAGLSVGQRQSLGLARIYLADPQIVLLDEPTAAMDQNLERDVIEALRGWLKGRTCILTTHRTDIVSLCDKVAVMEGGKVALYGDRDDVLGKLSRKQGA